jgi:DNA polymerase III delta subunit
MASNKQNSSLVEIQNLADDLERQTRPFYLFHGENHWFTAEAVKLLKKKIVAANQQDFSYEERQMDRYSDWTEVEAMLRSYSFFGGLKLIHIEIPGKLDDATRLALSDFLKETPGQNILCISAPNLDQLRSASVSIKKKGKVIKFIALNRGDLVTWTGNRLRQLNIRFKQDVPRMLADYLPGGVGEITSEIDKLQSALGEGQELTCDEVMRLVGDQGSEDIWQLASELKPGNEVRAMSSLAGFFASGDQNVQAMLGALTYAVTMLLKARLLLDTGMPHQRICGALPTYPARAREYLTQAETMDRKNLLAWIFNLQKLDYRLKSGSHDRARELVEITILESMAGRYLRS